MKKESSGTGLLFRHVTLLNIATTAFITAAASWLIY
jgi:hypothetical protein